MENSLKNQQEEIRSQAIANQNESSEKASAQLTPPAFQLKSKGPQTQESDQAQEEQVSQLQYTGGIFPNADDEGDEKPGQLKSKSLNSTDQPFQLEAKPNNTGLPDNLKSGVENLSGFSLDDVKVHYNSDKPAQLNAHAYAQGTDIHVASGQEKHLPHEAWHVVQQKQGRVQPTKQMKGRMPINDDERLEKEADDMGAKANGTAVQLKSDTNHGAGCTCPACSGSTTQLKPIERTAQLMAAEHDHGCSCPACTGSVSAQPAPAQLRLDENTYSSANIKGSGHKPKGFLRKSSFRKILDALDNYFKANDKATEYGELLKVKNAIAAYEGSKHRSKTSAGEQGKQALVGRLKNDIETEINSLKSGFNDQFDNSMYIAFKGDDEEMLVNMVGENFAAQLGFGYDDFLSKSPAFIKDKFKTEIYLKARIKEQRAEDTGKEGALIEQIDFMLNANAVDENKLTDGSNAKKLITLLKTEGIGKSVKNEYDPKFGQNANATEEYQPDIEGWNKSNFISLKGGDTFKAKIKGLVNIIYQTNVGKRLMSGLGGPSGAEGKSDANVHSENKKKLVTLKPPSLVNIERQDSGTGENMYKNSAQAGIVSIDPSNNILGSEKQGQDEPWRRRDAVIALFHELVHVYAENVPDKPWESLEDPEQTYNTNSQDETRVTGIKVQEERNGRTYTWPLQDPSYNYVSENTFRKEYAALKDEEEYYVRPYYSPETFKNQVQGPTDKQKVREGPTNV